MITPEITQLIKQLKTYARPLEKAQIDYLFFDAPKQKVIDELAQYQNEDGGFGHGLEPDCWNPDSSPIQSWAAMSIIKMIELKSNHSIVVNLLKYLEGSFDEKTQSWPRLIKTNDLYPHAPWWTYREEDKPDFNPSASIAGFVLRYAKKGTKVYQYAEQVALRVLAYIGSNHEESEVHELACIMDMANDLPLAHRGELLTNTLKNKLLTLVDLTIEKDEKKWFTSYVAKPSSLIKDHPSLGSNLYQPLMFKEFNLAMLSRNEAGIWPVTWNWGMYPEAFLEAAKMWVGIIGCGYLYLMLKFGYIKK